ncbi:MAG TPA: GNAT family N-acetyltransferase [Acidimicrobiales bacterium]|nr:GNAT family N-acetyltransferase [Acidimicrobiales bacterium]
MSTTLAAGPTDDLENGHRPTTADGDNLVLDHIRAEAAAYATLATTAGGRVHHVPELQLRCADLGVATPFGAGAFLEGPAPDTALDELSAQLHSFFGGSTGGPFLLFAPWPITDLTDRGFARIGHPPLMFRPAGGNAPVADNLRIVEVRDVDTLADFERTLILGYPVPEMQPWVRGSFLHPEVLDTRWRFFVGYRDDQPVATAACYVTDVITMIELVAVLPEARGGGVGAAITAAATLTEPTRPATLIASDLGRPTYDRLGYVPLIRYSLWLGQR